MNQFKRKQKLKEFFIEDIGDHDYSSDFIFPKSQKGIMSFTTKDEGIFCGGEIIREGYQLLDPSISITIHTNDGEWVHPGERIATVEGPVGEMLKGERVILNLIQRMSGIATLTSQAVHTLADDNIRICDTRKTTPGLRIFEKYAVRTGGGFNHRFGLYDAIMLKDNHIAFFGSIKEAVSAVKAQTGHAVKIEIETETDAQVVEAVEAGVDIIMFDNREPDEIEHLTTLVPPWITTEASGGITLESLSHYRGLDIQYLSLGFITHSAKSLDISADVTTMKEEV
ncbi:nicotinate-nucleotide pyrophosphorylase [carboxylating] [Halobacillus karajensis]|uniref:Probable nicotinate-nucleotide pyrophosphorylase [carboxylating] n=1 Tax=Halobacillus karajensis TaxID=195088 RepID=A0A024P976_9BACI|nr:carboxylating nicotinate-nucleotide diphosphorylase [Halobacillus karajensis]CDQ21468.1 putative nicotinate-nucleotide pyrophosphorylase [carboxylating] [Halobacillus karajensis]CDQ25403.1 putative nicotinate-nucleotide pyrophosphorylase [carboxylating] [Halobacillus karajensis]CDQ29727.1 putative nicotinate-nucleotide pyrophosphorylase [carboxylating] [Halobacillus karajensis]SEI07978.1 nicotinate-nucleotide pyrophosphorylase [carboxylating] [Halobacillus karajensis]